MKTDLKTIDAMIASITTRGKKLRNDTHGCLVAICEHHSEHGDYSRLPKLLAAVKASLGSSMSAAMIDWVERFYPGVKFDKDNGKPEMGYYVSVGIKMEIIDITADMNVTQTFTGPDGKKVKKVYEGSAKDFPFYDLEREVVQQPFNLAGAIATLVKRAETALEKNLKEGAHNVVNAAQVKILKSLGETIADVKPDETVKAGELAPATPERQTESALEEAA